MLTVNSTTMLTPYKFLKEKLVTSLHKPQSVEDFSYPNSLNLISFAELNHTDPESTRIDGLTDYFTRIHHKIYGFLYTKISLLDA